jgi:hypothetical protein
MYGLVNRALQRFLCDTYGDAVWDDIARAAGLRIDTFEPLATYPEDLSRLILKTAAARLRQHPDDVLEDLGTHLVAHRGYEAPRRLLRFGGATFAEFLHSLDDLPDRARLALPDLSFPRLQTVAGPAQRFVVGVEPGLPGFSRLLAGVLRGMADDYGALALIDHASRPDGGGTLTVDVRDAAHAEGRGFALSVQAAS